MLSPMFKGVSVMSKNFKGVRISDMERTLRFWEGLREFYALMLWEEKKMTLFSIYCSVCSSKVFSLTAYCCWVGDLWEGYYIMLVAVNVLDS